MSALRAFFLSIIVLCSLRVVPALGQDGRDVLERLKARYEAVPGLVARFEQRTTILDDSEVMTGSIYLRGDSYRLETGTRTIVTDGQTVWVYDPSESQVVVSDYVEDETTFSITGLLSRFDERWRVAGAMAGFESGERTQVVTLDPKDPDDYFTRVVIVVRDGDDMVRRIDVTDASDVTMTFVLSDVQERPLDDDMFRFDAPDGIDVVDLRS